MRLGNKHTGMTTGRLEVGDIVKITDHSRRKFLRSFALGIGGVIGLKQSIESVAGKKVEGEPIVHTYDKYGNPDRVHIVSEERSQRINAWKRLSGQLVEKEAGRWHGIDRKKVKGIGIKKLSDDESDIALNIRVERDEGEELEQHESNIRDSIEQRSENIPIEVTEVEPENEGDRYNSTRRTILGGVKANGTSETSAGGTITLACYDSAGNELIVHSDHVMEGADEMHQPAGDDRTVGSLHERSEQGTGNDVTSYHADMDEIDIDARRLINWETEYVTGTWDHWGIGDEIIDNGSIEATLVGNGGDDAMKENEAIDVVNGGSRLTHQVYFDERNAAGGDSGGAWVDDDGKLLAVHSGWVRDWPWSDRQDVGASGKQALDAVDAQLYS